jgi:hypothetical protein
VQLFGEPHFFKFGPTWAKAKAPPRSAVTALSFITYQGGR